jgi:histidinol-phosphate aminotransferase
MIFLCNPNNPTGTVFSKTDFETFLESIPEVVVVVDEAYIEFVRDKKCAKSIDYLNADMPVVTLRTFSKAYGLAGLRIGYGIMPHAIADVINKIRPPFNAERLGIKYFPSQANFFLIDVGKNADEVFENMLRQGVIVRSMTAYGYPNYIRINVGLHNENVRFIKAIEKVI